MRSADFTSDTYGILTRSPLSAWPHQYFLPSTVPRSLPLSDSTGMVLAEAAHALGRLDGFAQLIQDPELLLGPSMIQEALSSSRIEGTQASLSDVLSAESESEPIRDENLREVDNYLSAIKQGVTLLERLPLTQRFFCALHETLLTGVRGEEKHPGEVRRSPVWIGSPSGRPESAKFIPPHQDHLGELLGDWEKFVNEPTTSMQVLVKCALMHYQFETIHPFLDGNGRIGRLLIGFMLIREGVLPAPILHISGFFETHRDEYYSSLEAVRETGAMEEWVLFFAEAVRVQAQVTSRGVV